MKIRISGKTILPGKRDSGFRNSFNGIFLGLPVFGPQTLNCCQKINFWIFYAPKKDELSPLRYGKVIPPTLLTQFVSLRHKLLDPLHLRHRPISTMPQRRPFSRLCLWAHTERLWMNSGATLLWCSGPPASPLLRLDLLALAAAAGPGARRPGWGCRSGRGRGRGLWVDARYGRALRLKSKIVGRRARTSADR